MYKILTLAFLVITTPSFAQTLSGEELLEKSINYHDPNNNWNDASLRLTLAQTRPSGETSEDLIEFKNTETYFRYSQTSDRTNIVRVVNQDSCGFVINGSTTPNEEQIKKHRLTCDRTKRIRNYYMYLYGLPMKLKDPGTIIDPQTSSTSFQGKEYFQLKVTYDEKVGKDTWYFYINKDTYAMEGYRFYHDESKNDGEYITLEGTINVNGLKIPKVRKWYINKDDKFLGSDDLTSAEVLR